MKVITIKQNGLEVEIVPGSHVYFKSDDIEVYKSWKEFIKEDEK